MSSPQIRRRGRERALEFLFSREFGKSELDPALEKFWRTFSTRKQSVEYAETLIRGVTGHRDGLDRTIDDALSGWSPGRVGHVERALLRVAVYEMRYEDVPPKVAINEAVELSRAYGSDESPGFINAVLDRLMHLESAP